MQSRATSVAAAVPARQRSFVVSLRGHGDLARASVAGKLRDFDAAFSRQTVHGVGVDVVGEVGGSCRRGVLQWHPSARGS
jgi:hypothetical protein